MQHPHQHSFSAVEALANGSVNPIDISNGNGNFLGEDHSVSSVDQDEEMGNFHVPHGLCTTRIFLPHFSFLALRELS
jgi:hypothetical protein